MCLLRKITYGEFSELVREKKITYNVLYFCIRSTLPRKKSAFTLSFSQESKDHITPGSYYYFQKVVFDYFVASCVFRYTIDKIRDSRKLY